MSNTPPGPIPVPAAAVVRDTQPPSAPDLSLSSSSSSSSSYRSRTHDVPDMELGLARDPVTGAPVPQQQPRPEAPRGRLERVLRELFNLFCVAYGSTAHQIFYLFCFIAFLPVYMIYFFVAAIVILIHTFIERNGPSSSSSRSYAFPQFDGNYIGAGGPEAGMARAGSAADQNDCLSEKELDKLFPVTTIGQLITEIKTAESEKAAATSKKQTEADASTTDTQPTVSNSAATVERQATNTNLGTVSEEQEGEEEGPAASRHNTSSSATTSPPAIEKTASHPLPLSHYIFNNSSTLMCAICQTEIGLEFDTPSTSAAPPAAQPQQAAQSDNAATVDYNVPVRMLSCGHVFHDECIRRWMCEMKPSCPLCNKLYPTSTHPRRHQQQERQNFRRQQQLDFLEGYYWI